MMHEKLNLELKDTLELTKKVVKNNNTNLLSLLFLEIIKLINRELHKK